MSVSVVWFPDYGHMVAGIFYFILFYFTLFVCWIKQEESAQIMIISMSKCNINKERKTCIGFSSTEFKKGLVVHRQTFNDPTVSQTSLSKYIHCS